MDVISLSTVSYTHLDVYKRQILYGALESGVLDKGNAYVYDINPAMMKKAEEWGVHLAAEMCIRDSRYISKFAVIPLVRYSIMASFDK